MNATTSPEELASACRVIFGPQVRACPDLLAGMSLTQVKRSYRRRALESHPDRATVLGNSTATMDDQFKALSAAYATLCRHLGRGESPHRNPRTRPQPRASQSPRRPESCRERRAAEGYWAGSVPDRRLTLGQFLYYTRRICRGDWTLCDAWQQRQRPTFGGLAVAEGYLTAAALNRVVQNKARTERLGETAVRLRRMTPHERDVVLRKQQRLQPPEAQFFVDRGLLSRDEVTEYVRLQQQHNARFGGA
jgi:hypothetical protein